MKLRMRFIYTFVCFVLGSANVKAFLSETSSEANYQNFVHVNELEDGNVAQKENILENSYHGLIRENETVVEITPLIKVDPEKICDFRIIQKLYHEIPFQIKLVNNLGILKARRILNCEKRKSYHFEIVAFYCDGTPSNTANVHITVIDINEYAPTFLQPSYVTEVDEGRLYNEIIRVEARDKDCTPLFGDVCKYEILNSDEPFTIDNEGSIKNTEPLAHKVSHNHILSIVAYDCAMKESSPIMVSIKVRRVCEVQFLGMPERIDYVSDSTESLQLFPNAHLEMCGIFCKQEELDIQVSIALKTKHISFGCDRDVSNCSLNSLTDLLPYGVEWTKDLNYDEGSEPVFHFDGFSGVVVPDTIIRHQDFSTNPFSIVTIFRHDNHGVVNKHVKEHIICSADDHKMNRHHMALFVRNCRLILLLRKSFNEGDLNIFSPAEWRWKIPQVCDNEWHHYVVNVDESFKVDLYIDGIRFKSSSEDRHNNPEVIDDWPLHAAHGINTTLAVGACYQSSENRLKHGFKGDISEVKVSIKKVLAPEEIACGANCAEHLLPPVESMIEFGNRVQTNPQFNEIFIEGNSADNIDKLMQNIQYINIKKMPTVGRRNIEVRTTMLCINQSVIRLPTFETYVMVNEPTALGVKQVESKGNGNFNGFGKSNDNGNSNDMRAYSSMIQQTVNKSGANLEAKYIKDGLSTGSMHEVVPDVAKVKIIINGRINNLVSYMEIKSGVHILDKLSIAIMKDNKGLSNQTLDSCSVVVFPSLNPDHEDIQIDGDESLSSTMDIKTNINKDGVEMIGNDAISNYLNVLQALVYSNKKPAYYLNRVFKLSCAQLDPQYISAEFTLTLTVLHPKQMTKTTSATNTAAVADRHGNDNMPYYTNTEALGETPNAGLHVTGKKIFSYALMHSHDVQEPKSHVHSIIHKAESARSTMLIVLICVFFIMLICGVSIARMKNNNNYANRHQPCPKIGDEGLIWDDSALTITINPMQSSDAVSGESSDSENSESEDEGEKDGFAHINQLEWDNSNMFSTAN